MCEDDDIAPREDLTLREDLRAGPCLPTVSTAVAQELTEVTRRAFLPLIMRVWYNVQPTSH
jgi:hypothetical protein